MTIIGPQSHESISVQGVGEINQFMPGFEPANARGIFFFFSSGLGKKQSPSKDCASLFTQSSHFMSINCSGEERSQGRKLNKNYTSGPVLNGHVNYQTTENKYLRKTNCGKWDF